MKFEDAFDLLMKEPEKYFLFKVNGELKLYEKREDDGLDLKPGHIYTTDKPKGD